MARNQRHVRQSLNTPFATIPELHQAVDPNNPSNKIEQLLNGTFVEQHLSHNLQDIEKAWIRELETRLDEHINQTIYLEDFIRFFKKRKEHTCEDIQVMWKDATGFVTSFKNQTATKPTTSYSIGRLAPTTLQATSPLTT